MLCLLGIGRSLHTFIKAKSPTIQTILVLYHLPRVRWLECLRCEVAELFSSSIMIMYFDNSTPYLHLQELLNTLITERKNEVVFRKSRKHNAFRFSCNKCSVRNEERDLIVRSYIHTYP